MINRLGDVRDDLRRATRDEWINNDDAFLARIERAFDACDDDLDLNLVAFDDDDDETNDDDAQILARAYEYHFGNF